MSSVSRTGVGLGSDGGRMGVGWGSDRRRIGVGQGSDTASDRGRIRHRIGVGYLHRIAWTFKPQES